MCCENDCFGNDMDDTFGYNTYRVVRIRDRRLGICMRSIQFLVACYIIGGQLVAQQYYRLSGNVVGSGGVSLLDPSPASRTGRGLTEATSNPYCVGSANNMGNAYTVDAARGSFQLSGSSHSHPQHNCTYQDVASLYGAASFTETGGAFLPSLTVSQEQTLQPVASCGSYGSAQCSWTTDANFSRYTADIEFFKLKLTHSFVSNVGLSASSAGLLGTLLDSNGDPMDPCQGYITAGLACPADVGIGTLSGDDILPLKTLLLAAGIPNGNLDSPSDVDPTKTYRQMGMILILAVHYTNYALSTKTAYGTGYISEYEIRYFYTIERVANIPFVSTTASFLGEDDLSTSRILYSRSGVHAIMTFDGRIGFFNLAPAL